MSNDNKQELFEYLFALRISLQDSYENEYDIIRELKIYLFDIGYNNNNVNELLHDFYENYGINISIDTIRNISSENQLLNNMLGFMLGQGDFETNYEPEPNQESDNEDDIPEPASEDELDEEEQDEPPQGSFSFTFVNPNGQQINFSSDNINNIQFPPEMMQNNNHQTFLNIINSIMAGNIANNNQTFQDVSVTVEEDEIEKLKQYKLDKNLDYDCSVCMSSLLENDDVKELKCSHVFHCDCIDTYLKQYNHKCPICRAEVGKVKYNT
jgi:hypothetical protein